MPIYFIYLFIYCHLYSAFSIVQCSNAVYYLTLCDNCDGISETYEVLTRSPLFLSKNDHIIRYYVIYQIAMIILVGWIDNSCSRIRKLGKALMYI